MVESCVKGSIASVLRVPGKLVRRNNPVRGCVWRSSPRPPQWCSLLSTALQREELSLTAEEADEIFVDEALRAEEANPAGCEGQGERCGVSALSATRNEEAKTTSQCARASSEAIRTSGGALTRMGARRA